MYKIGELSRLSHIPVKTLRYYDSEGLLPPDYIDEFTGYRYYSAAKLSDCYRILSLKELGFSLNEIKELFSLSDEKFSELLDAKTKELQQLIKQTEDRIHILRSLNSTLKENTTMFDIVVRNSNAIRLLYQRKIITDKSECNCILSELHNAIPARNLGSRTVLIDYETEFATKSFDTGFGVEIMGDFRIPDGFSEKMIQFTTDTANLICVENEYEDALKTLHKYALDNNYQIVGPTYKIIYQDNTVELKLPVVKLEQNHSVCKEKLVPLFENDEEVLGHWELFDLLPCREMFHPQKQKSIVTDKHIKELYFLPNGEKYWCFSWTKGLLFSDIGYPHNKVQNKYTVVTIDNQAFLFVEFKGKDYSHGGQPEIWVYKKTDSKKYTKQEIELHDEIPDVPADDTSILGTWEVCSLVKSPEDFQPHKECSLIPYEGLCWRVAEFLPEGILQNSFLNASDGSISIDNPHVWRWITGYVICNPRSTASRYVIKEIDGVEYLFAQWKSGDYFYGRKEPSWYVFKK